MRSVADRGKLAALAIALLALLAMPESRVPAQAPDERVTFDVRLTDRAEGSEVWMSRLIVDGTLRRFDDGTARSPTLVPTARWASGLPKELRLDEGAQTATLHASGGFVVLVGEFRGVNGMLSIARGGTPITSLDLEPGAGRLAVDARGGGSMPWGVGVLLILATATSLMSRPWRGVHRGAVWLGLVLGAWHLATWLWSPVGTTNDSTAYLEGVGSLRAGELSYFPPGYAGLLGLLGADANPFLGLTVTLVQHVLVVVAAIWLYQFLSRILPPSLALAGGVLTGGLTTMLTSPQTVMTETPAMFAMIGTLFFAVRSAEGGRMGNAVAAGLCCGWATLLRVVPVVALVPAVVLILLIPRCAAWRRQLLAFTLTLVACVALPVTWFGVRSGQFGLADSAPLHLYNRVVTEQGLVDRGGTATRELIERLGDNAFQRRPWWEVTADPGLDDLGSREHVALLRAVAMEGIRSAPVAFLSQIPPMAMRTLFGDPRAWIVPWGESEEVSPVLENPPVMPFRAEVLRWRWSLEEWHAVVWPALALLSLIGIGVAMVRPWNGIALGLAWIPIGYLVPTAALEMYSPRYHVPITGMVVALALLACHRVVTASAPRTSVEHASPAGDWRGRLRAWAGSLADLAPGEAGR